MAKKEKHLYKVQFTITCDYAVLDVSGKLSVLGIFDNITAPQLPYVHPAFFIVSSILSEEDIKDKKMVITVKRAEDEQVLVSQEIPATAELSKEDKYTTFNAVLQVSQLPIEKTGQYNVETSLDGEVLYSKFINVKTLGTKSSDNK